METEILEPIKEYRSIYRHKHEETVQQFFDETVKKSGADVELNQELVKKYNKELALYNEANKKLKALKGWRTFLIILSIICGIAGGVLIFMYVQDTSEKLWALLVGILLAALMITGIILTAVLLGKKIKNAAKITDDYKRKADEFLKQAWHSVAPLVGLFNDEISTYLIEKTTPLFDFDSYLDQNTIGLLEEKYGLNTQLGPDNSIIALKSGRITESPFLLARILHHNLGTKTYTGSLTISWTETYYSNGKMNTRTRTQTLTASVDKPYPYYGTSTKLIFANEAAPKLVFSRAPGNFHLIKEKQQEKELEKRSKEFAKKAAKKASSSNFTAMANEEFESLFNALNRTSDIEFRLLFTPLAQISMVELIKDSDFGFGDDFYFDKVNMVNYITPHHLELFDMSGSVTNYMHHDIKEIERRFNDYQNEYFRHFFFAAAPILAIPLYQQHKPLEYLYKGVYKGYLANWQHEALANSLPIQSLAHPDSITNNILKTRYAGRSEDGDVFNVIASGYRGIDRVDYIPRVGGDGYTHQVPVYWTEYIPVSQESTAVVKVDKDKRFKNEHFDALRNRINSYLQREKIETFGSYYTPYMYAFVAGDDAEKIAKINLDKAFID